MSCKRPTTDTQRRAGFTLIETLVAVSIVTLAVAGPLYAANRALVAAQIARNQLAASFLSQEGVEWVRNVRDTQFLLAYQAGADSASGELGTGWSNFLSYLSTQGCRWTLTGKVCTLDPMGTAQLQAYASSDMAPVLYLATTNTGAKVYVQNPSRADLTSSATSPFTRVLQITDTMSTDPTPIVIGVQVKSTVSWKSHGTDYWVQTISSLTPWQ